MGKYKTINVDYPEYKIYIKNLEKLKKYNFNDYSPDEIYHKYHDLALILPSLGAKLVFKEINGYVLYRARLSRTIGKNEDLSLIQSFSFPPPSVCKNKQRANINYKSVFYCADEAFPAIKECGAIDGEEGYLSIWKINANRDLNYASCLPEKLPHKNRWVEYGAFHHTFLRENQTLENKSLLNHKIALRNLITDKFMKEKAPYHLSSMLANEYPYYQNNDLLLYPSVQTFQEYTNFAIHPNAALKQLECFKIYKFKLVEQGKEQVKLNFLSIGDIENDRIKWRNPTNSDGEELGFSKID